MIATSKQVLLALSLGAMVAGCTTELPSEPLETNSLGQPIINGSACGPDVEPSAVALIFDGVFDFEEFGGGTVPLRTLMCTGTLIEPDVVLTAAHCVDLGFGDFGGVEEASFYVSTEADLSGLAEPGLEPPPLPTDAMKASGVVAHPQFDPESLGGEEDGIIGLGENHDLGLVFLETPILDIEPAELIAADEADQIAPGNPVTIAGWGQRSPSPEPAEPAGGLKHCAPSFIGEVATYEMQIGGDSDSSRKCHGDSGGPTYMEVETDAGNRTRLVGVTSHAYDSSDCEIGGVDTRVDAMLPWLEETMTAACDAGQRPTCSDEPDTPEPDPMEEQEEELEEDLSDQGGCHLAAASRSGRLGGAAVGLFVLLLLGARRRRA